MVEGDVFDNGDGTFTVAGFGRTLDGAGEERWTREQHDVACRVAGWAGNLSFGVLCRYDETTEGIVEYGFGPEPPAVDIDVAEHEAAHAIVAACLGWTVESVALVDDGGGRTACGPRPASVPSGKVTTTILRFGRESAIVALAGPAMDRDMRCRAAHLRCLRVDYLHAGLALSNGRRRLERRTVASAYSAAVDILRAHEPRIVELAGALERYRRIEGAEIARFLPHPA